MVLGLRRAGKGTLVYENRISLPSPHFLFLLARMVAVGAGGDGGGSAAVAGGGGAAGGGGRSVGWDWDGGWRGDVR